MGRLSEFRHELVQSERHLAEARMRFARQAEFVRERDAAGHYTTFSAKRLLVLAANLNEMERHRQQIVRGLSVSQRELAA
jgi:hypothetical protein